MNKSPLVSCCRSHNQEWTILPQPAPFVDLPRLPNHQSFGDGKVDGSRLAYPILIKHQPPLALEPTTHNRAGVRIGRDIPTCTCSGRCRNCHTSREKENPLSALHVPLPPPFCWRDSHFIRPNRTTANYAKICRLCIC